MAKITQKEVMGALEQGAVVVVGGPVVQMIPVVGPALDMLPTFALGPVSIALPSIIAGAVAVLGYNLVRAYMK